MIDSIIAILILAAIVFLYFLPSYAAYKRKSKNADAICILNTLLGWTLIGWVVSLVWAFAN